MANSKIVKAFCPRTNRYFGLELRKFGSTWKVVNMVDLKKNEYDLLMSQVVQSSFVTNDNLLPCAKCGSRAVGGCACSKTCHRCSSDMGYQFDCIYCNELRIDYSFPIRGAARGEVVSLPQSNGVKLVNFSNVPWIKYDCVQHHPSGAIYHEPRVHVLAEQDHIEFHGYNISRMQEGVYYDIGMNDDFGIECDVDTSTIKPHPGGHFSLQFGPILASVNQLGGAFYINTTPVAQVGSRFKMQLLLTEGGHYCVFIDGTLRGELRMQNTGPVRIIFGFAHEEHNCELLSHAYLRGIKMIHSCSSGQ